LTFGAYNLYGSFMNRASLSKRESGEGKANTDLLSSTHLVTKQELAVMYSVSTRTIENWMAIRIIPFFKVGRTVRFDPQRVAESVSAYEVLSGCSSRKKHGKRCD
jgi:hypothetical protein